MSTRSFTLVCVVGLIAPVAPLVAGEERGNETVIARVNGAPITREDILRLRRYFTMANPQATFDNRQILDYAINRLLWEPYLEKENLLPSGPDIQRAIQHLDAQLRQRGSTYQRWIGAHGLTHDELLPELRFELAMQRLAARLLAQLQPQEIQAEFAARPEWHDGSRVRISEIFVDTRHLANDPDKLKKAKQRIERMHEQLLEGKDFDLLGRDYSEGRVDGPVGDLGWFFRNGKPVEGPGLAAPAWPFDDPMRPARIREALQRPAADKAWRIDLGDDGERKARVEPLEESLIAAAWGLKIGEFTRPVQSTRGWHILKVTAREGAHLTFFGAKEAVSNALVRRRTEAILVKLRAGAKIEVYLDSP